MIRDIASPDTVALSSCRYGRLMHMARDNYMGRALSLYGEYSESEVELFRAMIQPTDIVVDAGANVGAHTIALSSLVTHHQGYVLAFEPLTFQYHILCGNLALNGITNVMAYHAALGAVRGGVVAPAVDYTQEGNYGGIPLGDPSHVGNTVPLLTLDSLNLPRLNFLKADVEGMELDVLKGAANLIARHRPTLYLENNPPYNQHLIDYIHSIGYDLWWHYAPLYNPDNHNHIAHDIYRTDDGTPLVSHNMLALPSHPDNNVVNLERIERNMLVHM